MFLFSNVIRLWIESEIGEVEIKSENMEKTLEKISADVIKGRAYVYQNGDNVTVNFPHIIYKLQLGGNSNVIQKSI